MSGWTAVRLDEVEAIAWPFAPLTWRPLRHALGGRIVGMGAFTADRAGEEVVEAIARPRAAWATRRSTSSCAAGRRSRSTAPSGTAVLALGGPPAYEPSSSEWIERARPHIRADPERARAIVDDLRAQRPDSPGIPIAEALLAVGAGDDRAAREALSRVDPRYREALRANPDLGPLAR